MRRITAAFLLLIPLLVEGPVASAESVEARTKLGSTATRIRGATTILPVPWGVVAVGGSSLRHLPRGKTNWETLHRVKGDNLYRIAGDERGRLLAAWEKEALFHLFVPKTKQHLTFPKPVSPSEDLRSFRFGDLYFSEDGAAAIVFMRGETRGSSIGTSVVYRYPLDGKSEPTMLFRQKGHEVHNAARLGLYLTSTNDREFCDNNGCSPLSSIVALEISGSTAAAKTLLAGKGDEFSNARMVWGSDREQVAMVVTGRKNSRHLLRWNFGDAKADLRPVTDGPGFRAKASRLTKSGVVLELWGTKDGGLEIKRHAPNGWARSTTLAPLPLSDPDIAPDRSVHGLRERKNGDVVLHWGNHLVLVPRQGDSLRILEIESLLKRRNEWAGADMYVEEPEALWIGIEIGAGRDFVVLPFAEIERRATALK